MPEMSVLRARNIPLDECWIRSEGLRFKSKQREIHLHASRYEVVFEEERETEREIFLAIKQI